jgi:DNA repair protein RadA/Sms
MAVKTRLNFVCHACGSEQPRWLGRCPDCGGWNTLEESLTELLPRAGSGAVKPVTVTLLDNVETQQFGKHPTGMPELDRVLGGGLIRGAVILLAGEPGIGKSTLALQILAARKGGNNLYVSGEEALTQIKERAQRLGLKPLPAVTQETNALALAGHIAENKPDLLIVDSVQTLNHPDIASASGTVGQVRESAACLIQAVKNLSPGTTLILIGHVTKDGAIAGPRVLEHMVDTVLFFEGERVQALRMLRSYKNRFGPSHELGLFEMQAGGLAPVGDLMALLDHPATAHVPGSAWTIAVEGSRPLAIEIQCLLSPTPAPVARRTVNGVDTHRIEMILAILERHVRLPIYRHDVYVNVVGGFKITDPAADVAIAMAVTSSYCDQALPPRSFFFGELGLAGEIRKAPQDALRRSEAKKFNGNLPRLPLLLRELAQSQFDLKSEN